MPKQLPFASPPEADVIDERLKKTFSYKELSAQYPMGNVYVKKYRDGETQVVAVTSEPEKFEVAYISSMGVPYLRKLNKGTYGPEWTLPPELDFLRNPLATQHHWYLEQDPEQVDALLLQREYEPMAKHKEKLRLLSEIQKHNKSITIPTHYYDENKIKIFLKSLKVGDKFWTGTNKPHVVREVFSKTNGRWGIVVVDMNQKEKTLVVKDFVNTRLYKAQPRSYTKEAAM